MLIMNAISTQRDEGWGIMKQFLLITLHFPSPGACTLKWYDGSRTSVTPQAISEGVLYIQQVQPSWTHLWGRATLKYTLVLQDGSYAVGWQPICVKIPTAKETPTRNLKDTSVSREDGSHASDRMKLWGESQIYLETYQPMAIVLTRTTTFITFPLLSLFFFFLNKHRLHRKEVGTHRGKHVIFLLLSSWKYVKHTHFFMKK